MRTQQYRIGIPVFLVGLMGVMLLAGITLLLSGFPAGWNPFYVGSRDEASTPTPAPVIVPGSISGFVWHDQCVGGSPGIDVGEGMPAGCVLAADGSGYVADGVFTGDEPGIEGVWVDLGSGSCPSTGAGSARTNAAGVFVFPRLEPGGYCLSVNTMQGENALALLAGRWSQPLAAAEVANITVAVNAGELRQNVNFGWDYAQLPVPAPTPTTTPLANMPTPEDPDCYDRAAFVLDVTVPDNTALKPGAAFDKIWRLRNTGTCRWTPEYDLVYLGGQRMGGAESVPLSGEVAPGSSVDLKVRLAAPSANGTYRGNWMLRDADGVLFGVGEQGQEPFWVQIVVGPKGSVAPLSWRGEYFNNRSLKGPPAFVRDDPSLDFDWRRGAPSDRLPADNFSVRWTGKVMLDAGTYRFTAFADDGIRFWVDDQRVMDSWVDGARELSVEVGLAKGAHALQLEYYEHTGAAEVSLEIQRVKSPTFSNWKGEYWPTDRFKGEPALVRDDEQISFRWGRGAPAVGLPQDRFNVRWTRQINFQAGTYRLSAIADDGIRIFVDGNPVLDEWHTSAGTQTYTVDLSLSGKHSIVVEYFERTGAARAEFWYQRISMIPTPTPTTTSTEIGTASPTATATPTATPEPTFTPTPTVTATQEPTPTLTATPTEGPGPQVAYDFAERYCSAAWRSGAGGLLCPGVVGDSAGFVVALDQPLLEGGTVAGDTALVTVPEATSAGWIEGRFPFITIEPGDRFKATLGCLGSGASCNVIFKLGYLTDANPDPETGLHNLGTWAETLDGQTTEVDIGLTPLTATNVSFVFTVVSGDSSAANLAFWLRPAIWR